MNEPVIIRLIKPNKEEEIRVATPGEVIASDPEKPPRWEHSGKILVIHAPPSNSGGTKEEEKR